jgi:hypothetical protein
MIPVAAMAIADGLGELFGLPGVTWYQPELMMAVYASMAVSAGIGALWLRGSPSVLRIGSGSLAASLTFYLFSNFAIWAGTSMYPSDAGGLLACYVAGLPFLSPTIAGDLVYSGLFFGAMAWAGSTHRARATTAC